MGGLQQRPHTAVAGADEDDDLEGGEVLRLAEHPAAAGGREADGVRLPDDDLHATARAERPGRPRAPPPIQKRPSALSFRCMRFSLLR